ncbi:Uncharacterized protein Fot_20571 [Forsythia ovata]|uniref:Uncharacterized protein n=1 Tax=Forsythia ovata TaxID=205694 RepID=A0ABD1USD8_9LAMI
METPSRRTTRSMGVSPGGENKTDSNASGRRRTTFSTPTEDAKTKEITKMKACKTDSTKKSKKNLKRKSYIPQKGNVILHKEEEEGRAKKLKDIKRPYKGTQKKQKREIAAKRFLSLLYLRAILQTTKKGNSSISEYFLKMKEVVDTISSTCHIISDEDLLMYIMNGLGFEYNDVVVNLTA